MSELISYNNIKEIDLTLENLFYFSVPKEYLGVVKINSVYDGKRYCVSELALSIRRGFYCHEMSNDSEIPLIYIHNYRDIKWLDINYENGEKQMFRIECWEQDSHFANIYQYSKFNKFGDLFICVSEKNILDSIFPDEIINTYDYKVNEF